MRCEQLIINKSFAIFNKQLRSSRRHLLFFNIVRYWGAREIIFADLYKNNNKQTKSESRYVIELICNYSWIFTITWCLCDLPNDCRESWRNLDWFSQWIHDFSTSCVFLIEKNFVIIWDLNFARNRDRNWHRPEIVCARFEIHQRNVNFYATLFVP